MNTQKTSNEIMAVAKAYRKERNTLKQAEIVNEALIGGIEMSAFMSAIKSLANPETSIDLYTTKAGKVSGLIIQGKEFGHRGLYLPFNVIENFGAVIDLVNEWKLNPTVKY